MTYNVKNSRLFASPEQATGCSALAPIEGRLSGLVDVPNACATVYLATEIFEFPVAPSADRPVWIDPGQGAPYSAFAGLQQTAHPHPVDGGRHLRQRQG